MKLFKINVITMRSYILCDYIMPAESEKDARIEVWCWLATHGYLDKELFYKIELKEF